MNRLFPLVSTVLNRSLLFWDVALITIPRRVAARTIVTRSKVPYVDPPQLNAIRHAQFRTQKVLFRAVPSRYLRNRDISNFRTMVQKFRFRQTTVQICVRPGTIYIEFSYHGPKFRQSTSRSRDHSCGTKLWNRALWNQGGAMWCSSAHDVRISTVTTGSRRGAHE